MASVEIFKIGEMWIIF